jgi:hypothetical protein
MRNSKVCLANKRLKFCCINLTRMEMIIVSNNKDFKCFRANPKMSVRDKKREKSIYYRNEFQRDRDIILHSKAFRRLADKTQVFSAVHKDHIRSRLTQREIGGQVLNFEFYIHDISLFFGFDFWQCFSYFHLVLLFLVSH